MMKRLISCVIFFIFLASNSSGQQIKNSPDTICMHPEVEAGLPAGDQTWRQFLANHLNTKVPSDNKAPKGVYTVIVKFIVSREGVVSNIAPETNLGYGMEEEVLRVMKLSPKWVPALNLGQNVKSIRRQPVTFMVE